MVWIMGGGLGIRQKSSFSIYQARDFLIYTY